METLKDKVLDKLKTETFDGVPELAAALGVEVNAELISVLWELKREKLIHWQVGGYIKISSQGFGKLLERAAY